MKKNCTVAANALAALLEKHLEDLRVKNYSEYTVKGRRVHIGFFLDWSGERGITEPVDVTLTVLESYQRYVFHYRKKNGEPLGFTAQHARLVPLRVWFKGWRGNATCCTIRQASSNCRAPATACRSTCSRRRKPNS